MTDIHRKSYHRGHYYLDSDRGLVPVQSSIITNLDHPRKNLFWQLELYSFII